MNKNSELFRGSGHPERTAVPQRDEDDLTRCWEALDISDEWGEPCEEFSCERYGRRVHIKTYCKPYDENWNLYTTVDAATGRVLKQEYCPV